MVCRLITRSTHAIARDETVLTVLNALPQGPYHPLLLAHLPPLFLHSWWYLSGDLCRNAPLVDLPGPSLSFLQGRQLVMSWARQEIVELRLLASCLTEAILPVHFKQGWCLEERQQLFSSEYCSLSLHSTFISLNFLLHLKIFWSVLLPLSYNLLRYIFSLTEHLALFLS